MPAEDLLLRYFSSLEAAFNGLERAVVTQDTGPWGNRPHDILSAVMSHNLARLHNSVRAWALQARHNNRFRIDLKESGFPAFQEILGLMEAQKNARSKLSEMPDPTEIRADMVDQMLRQRKMPNELRKKMAERLFYQDLRNHTADTGVYADFAKPKTVRISTNAKTGCPYYVVYWSVYDGRANLPLLYTLVVEDSSDEMQNGVAERHFSNANRPPKGKPKKISAEQGMSGLPNMDLSDRFTQFVESHSAYSLNLLSIATALDKDFANLHPKQLRRFNLGPFYAGGITKHNQLVQNLLDKVDSKSENWLLTWTMQELFSKSEKAGQRRFWSSSPKEQIFHIDTDDVDCVQQGVSAVEYHALVPHPAYQAVYASGEAADIFGKYKCSIVTGHDVIRQI